MTAISLARYVTALATDGKLYTIPSVKQNL